MVSVVLPTFNELEIGWLRKILETLTQVEGIEIICVDGASSDGTGDFFKHFPVKTISTRASSRATRLNIGIQAAQGQLLLLHHPRSLLDPKGLTYLRDHERELTWGGFTHRFDQDKPLLRFTSWYSNHVRGKKKGIIYLDHCIFFQRALLGGNEPVPEIELFEDTALSLKLKKKGPPQILPFVSTTSAIRFERNGALRQSLINQLLKAGYNLKIPPKRLNFIYERGLALNGKEPRR